MPESDSTAIETLLIVFGTLAALGFCRLIVRPAACDESRTEPCEPPQSAFHTYLPVIRLILGGILLVLLTPILALYPEAKRIGLEGVIIRNVILFAVPLVLGGLYLRTQGSTKRD